MAISMSAKSFAVSVNTRFRMPTTSSSLGAGSPMSVASPFAPEGVWHQHMQVRRQLQAAAKPLPKAHHPARLDQRPFHSKNTSAGDNQATRTQLLEEELDFTPLAELSTDPGTNGGRMGRPTGGERLLD
jgi:hypothetical protein